ncbi:MAG: AAA family ATPase [Roseiflexaceae bacterium]|nr:AAA family ATPase [Roseiflexaceae bacterium]
MSSTAPPVRIVLLGDIRIEAGEERTSLPQRESLRRLMTRLALQPRQPFPRKHLAFTLWPDDDPADALANLRRHLHLLRSLLPPVAREWLVVSTQHIVWNAPPECQVDVYAFEREWTTLHEMEGAAGLYRGDLAPGIDTDDEILVRREALRQRYLALLKSLARTWMDRRDWDRAGRWARLLMSHDPWDEEAVRLAMTAATFAGNRTAALDMYRALAQDLERELHIQPAPETTALYHDILHHRLACSPKPDSPSATPLFIGRDDELQQLADLMRSAAQGRGRIVFVSGQPGIGKTSLVQEAVSRSGDEPSDMHVFWGYCQPARSIGDRHPYLPWRHILAAAALRLVECAGVADWLGRLTPLVPDLIRLRPDLIAPSQPDAAALRSAIQQGIQALALHTTLILIIEDAHWIDTWSLEVLTELADICPSLPLLIVVTHRSGIITPSLLSAKRTLRRQRCALDIHIQPFTPFETNRFLEQACAQETINAETLEEISRYTGGVPLFLREAAASLRDSHHLKRRGLTGLRDSLRMRLRDIGERNRQMLEAAAILGFSFADDELQQMLGWTPAAYASALDDLHARRLLIDTVTHGANDYAFAHHLIHEIILSDIADERAMTLHRQAARSLETVHADQRGYAARIAAHYELAHCVQPAARFWLEHARESTDLATFEQALDAIARAESLLTGTSREVRELRAQAAVQRGTIALYQGESALALSLLHHAVGVSREFPALHIQALVAQSYALYTRDRAEEARTTASQALELASSLQDMTNVVRALNIRGVSALMLGRVREAIDDLQHARAHIERLQPDASHGAAVIVQTTQSMNHLGTALVFAQEYAQARDVLDQTVALAQRSGLRRIEAAALTMIGQMTLNCGRYDEAAQVYTRSIEVAGISYMPGMWGKYAGRGWAYLRTGELAAARQDFEQGLRIATQVNSQYGVLLMQTYLTFVDLAQGTSPAMSLAQLMARADDAQTHPVVYMTGLLAGQLWRLLGDGQRAIEMHERALQAAQAANVPSFILHARAQHLFDQLLSAPDAGALAGADEIIEQARIAGELPVQSLGWLARAGGLFQLGRLEEAILAAERGVIIARACPDQPLIGEGLALLTKIRTALGLTAAYEVELIEAQRIARQYFAPLAIPLGMPDADRLRQYCLNSLLSSRTQTVPAAHQPAVAAVPRKRRKTS